MIRRLLVSTTIAGLVLTAIADSARADEIDTCANAYESAQRHHKTGDLKASISDAQTCARDVCPEVLKKDCSSWLTSWRAEERDKEKEKERERAAKERAEPSPAPSGPATPAAPTEPSRPVPPLTYVLGGLGLVALGGAAGFMLRGVNTRNDLDEQGCAQRGDCNPSEVDRART
jgi:ribosome modulation factor